jgi:hypothetical protein
VEDPSYMPCYNSDRDMTRSARYNLGTKARSLNEVFF